jgi:2-hydroxy-3-keto-5-methylthiopentenyl-1-phosphate phosphatase
LSEEVKTVVQCDFDGTITVEDVSFKMLEAYADSSWKQLRERKPSLWLRSVEKPCWKSLTIQWR